MAIAGINYMISQIDNDVNVRSIGMSDTKSISSFSDIFTNTCKESKDVSGMFSGFFSDYNVQTKVGNCDVSRKAWERNDFPIWEYFQKNSSADCLNKWRSLGPEPPESDKNIQRGLSQINSGEMVIIMPESLQKKMESDPSYAEEVLMKVQKWKKDYDREDNAIAASLGYNPELCQLSKSYCIQLDENGNVGDYAVIGGGMGEPNDTNNTVVNKDDHKIIKKSIRQEMKFEIESAVITERNDIDFESVAPYLMEIRLKKK